MWLIFVPFVPLANAASLGSTAGCRGRATRGREYVADVARFFEVTRGHVIIAGPHDRRLDPALRL